MMDSLKHEIKVSVIIPIYNTERYLKRCIDSIINQTYRNLDIILINDGSTDTSGKICDSYCETDRRISVSHQRNHGVSAARNAGIRYAAGSYIMFVDSDDWLESDMIEQMMNQIDVRKKQLIACNAFRENDPEKKIMDDQIKQDVILSFDELGVCDSRGTSVLNGPWGKLFDSKVIKNGHLCFDTQIEFGEDKLFVFQYTRLAEEVVCMAKPYYHYYRREDSVMNEKLSEKHFQMFQVYKRLFSYLDETSERYEILRQSCLRLVLWFRNKCIDGEHEDFILRLNKIEEALVTEHKLPDSE